MSTTNSRRSRRLEGINVTFGMVIKALVLAALVHLLLILLFNHTRLTKFGDPYYERIVPRTFQLERVEIDPRLLESNETEEQLTAAPVEPRQIETPQEERAFEQLLAEEVRVAPKPEETASPALSEKPRLERTQLERFTPEPRAADPIDLPDIRDQLAQEETALPGRPVLDLSGPETPAGEAAKRSPSAAAGGRGAEGFTNLDEMLADSGPITDGQTVTMDAGLLFDYDRYEVKPAAADDLRKLSRIIQQAPGARIVIEGHTDAFGTEQYNQRLSELRAEAVREWLVANTNLSPQRISTRGFGKQRLRVPSDRTVDEQALNRRVEIVIRMPRQPRDL